MSRKKKRRNKNHSKSPSNDGYFFCKVRGCKLPASPKICERCKKRCKGREATIAKLALHASGLDKVRLPTAPPMKIEPDETKYNRGEEKKEAKQATMEISLESYEED